MITMDELIDFRVQQQFLNEIYMRHLPDPFSPFFPMPMSVPMPTLPSHAILPPPAPLPGVEARLQNTELWRQFHQVGTEMIITKSGRRMFPSMRLSLSGLEDDANYCVIVEMVPIGDCRYKFSGAQWVPAGGAEPQSPQRWYLHPDSPATGSHWQAQPILFNKIKLTNNTLDSNRQVVLASMHKYQPRVYVIKTSDLTQALWAPQQVFTFPETQFIAVTAYQNDRITKLKIENNPFAKGFREAGQSRCKRKISSSPSELTSCHDETVNLQKQQQQQLQESVQNRFKTQEAISREIHAAQQRSMEKAHSNLPEMHQDIVQRICHFNNKEEDSQGDPFIDVDGTISLTDDEEENGKVEDDDDDNDDNDQMRRKRFKRNSFCDSSITMPPALISPISVLMHCPISSSKTLNPVTQFERIPSVDVSNWPPWPPLLPSAIIPTIPTASSSLSPKDTSSVIVFSQKATSQSQVSLRRPPFTDFANQYFANSTTQDETPSDFPQEAGNTTQQNLRTTYNDESSISTQERDTQSQINEVQNESSRPATCTLTKKLDFSILAILKNPKNSMKFQPN